MVSSAERHVAKVVNQTFSHEQHISFPLLRTRNAGGEPRVIKVNAGGQDIHRMYVDGG